MILFNDQHLQVAFRARERGKQGYVEHNSHTIQALSLQAQADQLYQFEMTVGAPSE